MAARRINPRAVKLHRIYDVGELAALLRVHKNTVRLWQREGLKPIVDRRPILFLGSIVREFLTKRNMSRKAPCPPGMIYCFKCRAPRGPAGGMVDFTPHSRSGGNLKALCESCGTIMHRRIAWAAIAFKMPGIDVQIRGAQTRLIGSESSPLNCDQPKDRQHHAQAQ